MIYLDTSALLKLYVWEPGSDTVQRLISQQDDPLPIWEIQEMELTNGLRLKVFWKEISEEQADEQLGFFADRKRRGLYFTPELSRSALMESFRNLSRHNSKLGCRTMDILHVACALNMEADQFVSFDKRQLELAGKAGLSVASIK